MKILHKHNCTMRLAIVSLMDTAPWGGSEGLWYALANLALDMGDDVFVSAAQWETTHPKIENLIRRGAVVRFRKNENRPLSILAKAVRLVKKKFSSANKNFFSLFSFRPDAIFVNQAADFDFAEKYKPLYFLIRQKKIPYFLVCHSHHPYSFIPPESIYPSAIEVFRNAAQVFFVSEKQRQLTQRKIISVLENSSITRNPLSLQRITAPLAWPKEGPVNFAMIGVLEGAKGQDTVLEVLGSALWKDRNWILNLYGSGKGEEYLRALAGFYNIKSKVFFRGYTNDIKDVWQKNQVLLMASSWEAGPLTVPEAMSCGRVVVAADIGITGELIVNGKTGFIAVSPAPDAFSYALDIAWSKQDEWPAIGEAAFEAVNQRVDPHPEKIIYAKIAETLKPVKS